MKPKLLASKDFLFINLHHKKIVVCGYLLGKKHESVSQQSVTKIINFLENTNQSYSIIIKSTSVKLLLFFGCEDIDSTTSNINKFLANFAILERFNNELLIIRLNYIELRKEIEMLLTPAKSSSDKRIFIQDDKFISYASIVVSYSKSTVFQSFLELINQNSIASISISRIKPNRPTTKKNNTDAKYINGIMLRIEGESLSVIQQYLSHLGELLVSFKGQMSIEIHFQLHKTLQANQLQNALGIAHKKCKSFEWFNNFDISKWLYNFASIENNANNIERSLQNVDVSSDNASLTELDTKFETEIEAKSEDWDKQRERDRDTLIPYGKKLSREKIQQLLDTIPLPP